MKYLLTVTKQKGNALWDEVDPKECEVILQETFDKQNSMLMWAKNWFKTTGANRKSRKVGNREVHPKEYVDCKVVIDMNFFGTTDFRDIYGTEWVDNMYARYIADWHVGKHYYNPAFGWTVVDVWAKNNSTEWTRLWLQVQNDDGSEYDPYPHDMEYWSNKN